MKRKTSKTQARSRPGVDMHLHVDPLELLEGSGDIIYALDLQGRFVYMSPSGERLLGYLPGEKIGEHFQNILTHGSQTVAKEHFKSALAKKEVSPYFDVEALRRDGSTLWLEVRASDLIRNGKVVGRQGVARDITELKRLRSELDEKSRQVPLQEERIRIAKELTDTINHVIFGSADGAVRDEQDKESLGSQIAKSMGFASTDLQIIQLVAKGRSNREIGESLYISADTVKTHIRRAMDRLGVQRRAELVAEAARRGLI